MSAGGPGTGGGKHRFQVEVRRKDYPGLMGAGVQSKVSKRKHCLYSAAHLSISQERNWIDSTVGRSFALHMADT